MSQRDKRRARVEQLLAELPEVDVRGGQHLKCTVRKKSFAYYLDDHHGDGIVSVCAKAGPGVMEDLIELEPDRYYKPSYLGPRSWVALRIDTPRVDWDAVRGLIQDAYRLTAPQRLVSQLDGES